MSYADSPSGHFYGKNFVVSHLEITGHTGVADFTKEDIGRQFSIGTGVVEIVDVDQDPLSATFGEVTELSIIDRGFLAPISSSVSITSLATGSTCDVTGYSVREQRVFFLQNNNAGFDTIALSCPFISILNLGCLLYTSDAADE